MKDELRAFTGAEMPSVWFKDSVVPWLCLHGTPVAQGTFSGVLKIVEWGRRAKWWKSSRRGAAGLFFTKHVAENHYSRLHTAVLWISSSILKSDQATVAVTFQLWFVRQLCAKYWGRKGQGKWRCHMQGNAPQPQNLLDVPHYLRVKEFHTTDKISKIP